MNCSLAPAGFGYRLAYLKLSDSPRSYAQPVDCHRVTPVSVLSKLTIAAASLGRADAVRYLVPNQMRALTPERSTAYKNGGVLANRMTLREGLQALDAQRLGRAGEPLQLALMQSNAPAPGEDSVIHVFPAWPKEWNGRFRLAARGAFVVSASIRWLPRHASTPFSVKIEWSVPG
jgi:hypothetical protein